MTSSDSDAYRLNEEGEKLFKSGDYRGAAVQYRLATSANDSVSVYFSNLAAAYDEAHAAANRALGLEPRALNARYRRAIARKHLKLFPEALVDISSVLTTDPDNRDAKAEFSLLVEMHKADGRRPLVPDAIIAADLPHAYGSSSNPPRANIRDLHQLNRPFFRNAMMSPTHTNPVTGLCHNCKVTMDRRDLKTCQKCRRVNYCSVQCQKIEWPEHKLVCAKAIDENMTIRLGRRLADHQYFVFHLILYALRSLGLPRLPTAKHDFVLMAIVDAVSVSSTPASKMRTTIKNIVAVPLCIVPEEVIDIHTALLPTMTPDVPVHGLWVATTGIYPEGESCRFRMNLLPAPAYLVSEIGPAHFSLDLYSHSYGVRRRVTAELDFLFESMNDELRLDVDNHYQMQG